MNAEPVIHRTAYHRLILPDGTVLSPGVVLTDDRGTILSWHQLQGEEPFTRWVGGSFSLNHKP